MSQHDATLFTYPVREIAHAWHQHAQGSGITDPETELLARPAIPDSPQAGYRPAFWVPSTGELVVIVACEPHRTETEAREWLAAVVERLHAEGTITLWAEEGVA